MKQYPFLDLRPVNEPYMQELKDAACRVIESGRYLGGENIYAFEKELAEFCESEYAVAVSNGLDALRLILRAYKELGRLSDGDEIIVPANTYVASVLAITDSGLVPVFVEPSTLSMNLDCSLIEQHITPRTCGIMLVHLYGTPCWGEQVHNLANRYNLVVVEDNAQAIGAKSDKAGLNGTCATGSLGTASAHSFYPTKNLGALGDAGAVTTNDKALADAVRAIANYGSDRRYHNIYEGLNCRMDEIQAAMLRVKLRHTEAENSRRAAVARIYNDCICNSAVVVPHIFDDMRQVWHQYVVRVDNRDDFRNFMLKNGVATDVLYATPPHRQPCYSRYASLHLPITEEMACTVVSLPIAIHITPDDARHISKIINSYNV